MGAEEPTMTDATVEVNHDICIVSGMCASLAPEIFDIDDDGLKLEVVQPTLPPEQVATSPTCTTGSSATATRPRSPTTTWRGTERS